MEFPFCSKYLGINIWYEIRECGNGGVMDLGVGRDGEHHVISLLRGRGW